MLMDLIANIAIFTSFLFLTGQAFKRYPLDIKLPFKVRSIMGGIFGVLGIFLITYSIQVTKTVIIDIRYAAIITSAILGGPLASIICAVIIAIFRGVFNGINTASLSAVIIALIVGFAGAYVTGLKTSRFKKYIYMYICAMFFSTWGFIYVLRDGQKLLEILPYFWIINFLGIVISYFACGYIISSNLNLKEMQYYRIMADNLSELITTYSPNGVLKYVSPSSKQLLGYENIELVGKNTFDFIHPEEIETIKEVHSQLEIATDILIQTFRMQRKDGIYVWVESSIKNIYNKDGLIEEIISVTRDVTMKKTMEFELLKSNEMFSSLVNSMNDMIYTLDTEQRYTGAFGNWILESDLKEDHILGKTQREIFGTENEQVLSSANFRALNGENVVYECFFEGNGVKKYYHTSLSPIKNSDGSITGIVGVGRDMTEYKMMEEVLRSLASIVEFSDDAIIGLTPFGIVTNWNPGAERIYGYSAREMIGKSISILTADTYEDESEIMLKTVRSNQHIRQQELLRKRKDGKVINVSITLSPITNLYGDVVGISSVARDITEWKKVEVELKEQRIAAEEANQYKTQFISNMSHEIRTPMNGIIGMVEALKKTGCNDEQFTYIDLLKKSADALMVIINDILDLSKIEVGMLKLNPIPFDLKDEICDTLRTLAIKAHEKGLEVTFEVSTEVPECLFGDINRIKQIIMNLVGNAIKFTNFGEINIKVDLNSKSDNSIVLHFSVTDTGIGIPKEKQKLIFESFTQVSSALSNNIGGTGLGLSISTKLVELMEGKLWVESEEDRGSTFHFNIALEKADKLISEMASKSSIVENLKILIVDDSNTNRYILKNFLSNFKIQVDLAESGKEALTKIGNEYTSSKPFDILLIDSVMPDMNGFELVLKANENRTSKIIMMLPYSNKSINIKKSFSHKNIHFIMKPVKYSELIRLLSVQEPIDNLEEVTVSQNDGLGLGRKLNILIAEDNEVNQFILTRILKTEGHNVSIASDGKEALKIFNKQEFDLILMDIQMPYLDGYSVTAKIRKKEKNLNRHTPIIALTAFALEHEKEKILASGMDYYLAKPIRSEDLVRLLNIIFFEKANNGDLCDLRNSLEDVNSDELATTRDIKIENLYDNLGRNLGYFENAVKLFSENAINLLSQIKESISERNYDLLTKSAHELKGVASYFHAAEAERLSKTLEFQGKNQDFNKIEEIYSDLVNEIKLIISTANSFIAQKFSK